ncbi:MAG: CvpA family protein [Verrucomicrobiota bacterium]
MIAGIDKWQAGFFLCAAVVLVFEMISGWRRGLVRQLFNMFAILLGYLVGFYGGKLAVPICRPMGYPDFVVATAGGVLIALLIMSAMSFIGALIFKKTAQQSVGIVRFFYGASGALIGVVIGIFVIWIALVGTRLLGTVAQSEVRSMHHSQQPTKAGAVAPKREPTALVRGIAEMKQSMDQPPIGLLAGKVDPIPVNVYSTLGKIVRMVTDQAAAERFLKFPGSKPIAEHPAVVALTKDPDIVAAIRDGHYFSLIKNRHIVEAANNPEVIDLVKRFELEKALDYSLTPDPKKTDPAKSN